MKEKSLRRNFIMNALLALSGVIFPLISFRYASRILLPAGTGKVSFAVSLIAYFSMFAQLGIPTYGIRACARVRDDRQALTRTAHELLGINLALDVLSYALLALALLFVPRLAEERLLYVVVSVTVLLESIGMEWLYKGLEQYTYITVRSIAFKIVSLGALFLLIHSEADYVLYGGISIFATSASNLLNFIHAGKYIDRRRPADCQWKRHLKPVLVFFAMSCAVTLYTNLDAVMLGFMTTDADVGFYNAAVKIKGLLVTLVTALGAVLLPRSSYYVEHGQMEQFGLMTRKALRFVLLLAAPLMLYFLLFAREGILFLSGEAYLPAVPSMRIIMPTLLLIGLTNILGIQVMVPLGREKVVLQSELAGAAVDLALNLLLIPAYRAAGAAIGTLVAEITVLAVQYAALRKDLRSFFRGYAWLALLAALGVASAACLWVKGLGLGPLLSLIVSAPCFFGAYVAFLLWRKEPLLREILDRVIRKIRRTKANV